MAKRVSTLRGILTSALLRVFARLGVALAVLAAIPCLAYSQQTSGPGTAAIRVSVERVNVGVLVTSADGKFVEGLGRDNFQVLDNGTPEEMREFASVDEPAKVLLLVEAGPAVYLLEGGHVRAAYALLAGLGAGDEVAVAKYNDGAEVVSGFSADKQAAAGAFERLNFNLGFGALNLSQSLGTALDWLGQTRGKKTLVLLSTGVDTSDAAVAAAVLQRMRVGDVRVLAVSLAGEMRAPAVAGKKKALSPAAKLSAEQFAAADETLRNLAAATGGRAYFPANGKEFDAVYAEIARIVRHEYSLGFAPAELDGAVHRIEVRVSGEGAAGWRVDHRWGYLAGEREEH